jgi:Dyp-type peroxidase family
MPDPNTSLDLLEPVLDIHDIQGNIIPGFNKDHETLIFFEIVDVSQAKKWNGSLSDYISSLYEVQNFKKVYKSRKQRSQEEPSDLIATWTNIAFSYDGIKKLAKNIEEISAYLDKDFVDGLNAPTSKSLGDPEEPSAEGNYNNWVIGGPKSKPDVMLIVASDDKQILETRVQSLINEANSYGLKKVYEITGHDLSSYGDPAKQGHEHFGFKDGISHPGVRGRLSHNSIDYLTPRPENPTSDPDSPEFSSYGNRPLIAPGQFVIGYPKQSQNRPRMAIPPDPKLPEALKNGSYLVFRRLRQDVEAFENFVNRESKKIANIPEFSDMTPEKLKAFLVGRWPSGAPLALSPDQDNRELAKDQSNNNKFDYDKDQDGLKTPVISHIRKVNPRNQATDQGFAAKTLTFSILRRGIPFGQPLDMSKLDPIKGDRGLLFLCYQTSIENQFELLVTKWMNSSKSPTSASSPLNNVDSGFDILVGQNKQDWRKPIHKFDGQDEMGKGRERFGLIERSINNQFEEAQIFTKGLNLLDWVIPTGGGYFFSPSISSLKSFFGSN